MLGLLNNNNNNSLSKAISPKPYALCPSMASKSILFEPYIKVECVSQVLLSINKVIINMWCMNVCKQMSFQLTRKC